jgi:DNA-binding transcriptional ArsR family regulator
MTYATTLQALADPTRRHIFERLSAGPRSVGQLAEGLPVSRPAVSQHLRVLREARLVAERREGTRNIYSTDARGIEELQLYLDRYWGDVLAAFKQEAEKQAKQRRRNPK